MRKIAGALVFVIGVGLGLIGGGGAAGLCLPAGWALPARRCDDQVYRARARLAAGRRLICACGA